MPRLTESPDPLGRIDYLHKVTVSPGLVDQHGDALTPDMVDADWWLSLPEKQGMEELHIDAATYRRVYQEVQDVVYRRDNRESQGGVHMPFLIKRYRANKRILHIPGLRP